MPEFIVRVGTPDGDIVERQVQAHERRAPREEELRQQGMHVFDAKRGAHRAARSPSPRRERSSPPSASCSSTRSCWRWSAPACRSCSRSTSCWSGRRTCASSEVLTDIREKLKSGVALSDAFASYGDAFPPIYSTSLRAGERSGDLEGVLRRFLRYQKIIVNLRKRVIGALIYPTVLIILSIGMVFIMLTKVIPKFAEFYHGLRRRAAVVHHAS